MRQELLHRKNIYFLGIGGIGMSALAHYFIDSNKNVAGYDRVSSEITIELEKKGIKIHYNDDISNIPEEYKNNRESLIIYTPAIPKNSNELNYFLSNNFEVLKRADVLSIITENTTCFAVAGTHGKTTTSAILSHILMYANKEVTAFLGGITENYQSNYLFNGNQLSVVEADEYDRSFLKLTPSIACITSVDPDHLDIYQTKEIFTATFEEFSKNVKDTLIIKKSIPIDGITYGIEENADFDAYNIRVENGAYVFNIKTPTSYFQDITIYLPGKHNVLNTVAALAMAHTYGVSLDVIAKALLTFKGIKRRFTYKIKTESFTLIDDYAHHPTEINVVADTVASLFKGKNILVIFQPHLFSRTRDFVNEFAKSLSRFENIVLLDIYPAREKPIEGVTSKWLLSKITSKNKMVATKNEVEILIDKNKYEVVLTIGAGDIGEFSDELTKKLAYAS